MSPNPSTNNFQTRKTVLALHHLSTPFHASLGPHTIDGILTTVAPAMSEQPRPRPLPPTPSPALSPSRHNSPASPTTSQPSNTADPKCIAETEAAERAVAKDEVKPCTWIRQLCPSAPARSGCDRVVSIALGRCYCHYDTDWYHINHSMDEERSTCSEHTEGDHELGMHISISISGGKESPLLGQKIGQGGPHTRQLEACRSQNPAVEYVMGLELCGVCLDTGVVVGRGGGRGW
jgi:hypothetical protein